MLYCKSVINNSGSVAAYIDKSFMSVRTRESILKLVSRISFTWHMLQNTKALLDNRQDMYCNLDQN